MNLKDVSTDELQAEISRRIAAERARWPKRVTRWAHTSKAREDEDLQTFVAWAWGQSIVPQEIWYVGAEIQVDFEVQEDGSATIAAMYTNGLRYEAVGPQHKKE